MNVDVFSATQAAASPSAQPTPIDVAGHHFSNGRFAAAEAICRQLIAASPDNAEALHILGLVAWQTGRMQEAGVLLARASGLRPESAMMHSNLGGYLIAVDRLDDAEAQIDAAIRLKPDYADAWCNRGNARRSRGDLERAQAAYERAIELAPRLASAHNNLGVVLLEQGHNARALVSIRAALSIDPNYRDARNNLGNALAELGRDDEAIEAYRKAIEIQPDYPEALNNLAQAMIRMDDPRKARDYLLRALRIKPDYAEAYHNLGGAYEAEGAFDEAYGCYLKAIALDPSHAQSYAGLATTRKVTRDDQQLVDRLERTLQELPRGGVKIECHLHFALGKAYDDLGEYDRAFEHYRRGNNLKRDHLLPIRFDPKEYALFITSLIDRYSHEFFDRWTGERNPSELPLLIVGMMRSGTTLTEQIVSSHPQIGGAGEQIFWADAERPYRTGAPILPEVVPETAARCIAHLRTFSVDALRVTDKMPHNFLHLGFIHLCFPNARIIHLRRNPVDTCLSIYFQNFPSLHPYAYDLEDLAPFYENYLRLMDHWRTILPPDRLLEVQYEELVADQEGVSRRMIEFAGLPWDERCLQFQDNKHPVRTASVWQVRQPMYKTSVARWKRYERHIGPLARLLDPSERPAPPAVDPSEIAP